MAGLIVAERLGRIEKHEVQELVRDGMLCREQPESEARRAKYADGGSLVDGDGGRGQRPALGGDGGGGGCEVDRKSVV